MMHAPLSFGWLILRTAPARTLALADSLEAAGFSAWTPRKTVRRRPIAGRRPMSEADVPIIPSVVFARVPMDHVDRDQVVRALTFEARGPAARRVASPHPPFSIFHMGSRTPIIADREVSGLRREEERAAEMIAATREAETREEARRARAQLLRTQSARRRAMRATGKAIDPDTEVTCSSPAFAGMTGTVVTSTDRDTKVQFGGGMAWTVETWLLQPIELEALPLAA